MAVTVLTDAYVSVNNVDLSDHVTSVTIETTDDDVEITAMGATAKAYAKGLGDANITVTFLQDFAAGKVDATLWPLKSSATTFPVAVRSSKTAVRSPTNPEYQLTAALFGYNPLDGGIGDASSTDVVFRNASQAGLQRLTA
jgi:hypothetical protein